MSLPYWATRLYKTAPLRHIVSAEDPHDGGVHAPHLVTLECGHRMVARLRRMSAIEDDHGVLREVHTFTFKEDRCRALLPRQRCKECREAQYPELKRLAWTGRYEERSCTVEERTRIEAHEAGEEVAPVPEWSPPGTDTRS